MLQGFVKIARILTILGIVELIPSLTQAQTSDPLVGSWNFKATINGCTTGCKYIGMISFNLGGTAVEERGTVLEYSGLGYVERTALGTWRRTAGTPFYTFRMKNFIFDSTGKLAAFIVGTSGVTLSSSLNSFTGSGTAKIFNANGALTDTEMFTITGTRF